MEDNIQVTDTRSVQELELDLYKALADANIDCDNKIRESMIWREQSVWLSMENQLNYKAAFDLMMQGMPILPQVFKLGDGYFEFTTAEDLTDFYLSSVQHVQVCLGECWQVKEAIQAEYDVLISAATEREANNEVD